jgi:Flp pilus assembly pilin Flp
MATVLVRLIAEDGGQDLAEYGIALAVVTAFVVAVALAISGYVESLWTAASGRLATVV